MRSPRWCWTGCRTGAPAGRSGSPRPRSATAWSCCWARWPPSGSANPTGASSPASTSLGQWLSEMAAAGEAVCVDGLATRVQRPHGMAQPEGPVRHQARHPHRPGHGGDHDLGGSTVVDGGWPGSYREQELIVLAGLEGVLDGPRSPACWTGGSAGWPRRASTGTRRSGTAAPRTASATPSGRTTACRQGCARWWSSRSPIWPTPGRCAGGAGCCTASETSTGPPAR